MASAKKFRPELRLDPVSKDWVLIKTGLTRKLEDLRRRAGGYDRASWEATQKDCPFDTLEKQDCPTHAFFEGEEIPLSAGKKCVPEHWTTIAFPNRYPAFVAKKYFKIRNVGPYQVADGVGFHEVIVTKSHTDDIPQFSVSQTKELFDMYHARYRALKDKRFVKHISIFKNSGPRAGASVAHPHSQIIAAPVTDPDILSSLQGSLEYFTENKKCIHCAMIAWDRKDKKRMVYENDEFIVFCPFASRVSFEMRVYPKTHAPYFEQTDAREREALADAFLAAMSKLYKTLKDPDYNYFLHTAPADGGNYKHYHWHWEILPRTAVWAGYELGSQIEVSTIEPEKAAAFLRKQDYA